VNHSGSRPVETSQPAAGALRNAAVARSSRSDATRRSKIALWIAGAVVRAATGFIATGFIATGFTYPVEAFGIGVLAGLATGVTALVLFWRPAIRASHDPDLLRGRRTAGPSVR
jgi:hypothetical protein